MIETWKPIPNWEALYEASSEGRIRSLGCWVPGNGGLKYRKGRVLARVIKGNGYPAVSLARAGERKQFNVHRLIAWTFLGPQDVRFQHVRHLNGQREDCRSSNLAYGTPLQNAADRDLHGKTPRGENHWGYRRRVERGYYVT
jgi:hypothetical protein